MYTLALLLCIVFVNSAAPYHTIVDSSLYSYAGLGICKTDPAVSGRVAASPPNYSKNGISSDDCEGSCTASNQCIGFNWSKDIGPNRCAVWINELRTTSDPLFAGWEAHNYAFAEPWVTTEDRLAQAFNTGEAGYNLWECYIRADECPHAQMVPFTVAGTSYTYTVNGQQNQGRIWEEPCSTLVGSGWTGMVTFECNTASAGGSGTTSTGNTCQPGTCPNTSLNVGSGVVATFTSGPYADGSTQTVDCESINTLYTGTATVVCDATGAGLGVTSGGCVPKTCGIQSVTIYDTYTYTNSVAWSNGQSLTVNCESVTNDNATGNVTLTCDAMTGVISRTNECAPARLFCGAATLNHGANVSVTYPILEDTLTMTTDCAMNSPAYPLSQAIGTVVVTCDAQTMPNGHGLVPVGECTIRPYVDMGPGVCRDTDQVDNSGGVLGVGPGVSPPNWSVNNDDAGITIDVDGCRQACTEDALCVGYSWTDQIGGGRCATFFNVLASECPPRPAPWKKHDYEYGWRVHPNTPASTIDGASGEGSGWHCYKKNCEDVYCPCPTGQTAIYAVNDVTGCGYCNGCQSPNTGMVQVGLQGVCRDANGASPPNWSKNLGITQNQESCAAYCQGYLSCVGYSYYTPMRRCALWINDTYQNIQTPGLRPGGFLAFEGTPSPAWVVGTSTITQASGHANWSCYVKQ